MGHWEISESTLSPVYVDDPRESIGSYAVVDTDSGIILDARAVRLVRWEDLPEGDAGESEIIETAQQFGFPLTDDFVN